MILLFKQHGSNKKNKNEKMEENPEILTEIEYLSEVDAYDYLFDFFYDEHGLTLLHSEMDDILKACDHFKKLFNGEENNNSTSS